jgi:hypothetical protein
MGYRQGNTGRGARHYGDELAMLAGRMTDEDVPYEKTVEPDQREIPEPARCEHGVLLAKDCHACAFMFGWEIR